MRAARARSFSLEALRSIMKLPFTLPRRIMVQVEMILRVSLVAVPALRRVEPEMSSVRSASGSMLAGSAMVRISLAARKAAPWAPGRWQTFTSASGADIENDVAFRAGDFGGFEDERGELGDGRLVGFLSPVNKIVQGVESEFTGTISSGGDLGFGPDGGGDFGCAIIGVFREGGIGQELAAERGCDLEQAGLLACGEGVHDLGHLKRVAKARHERLAHIRDESGGFAACGIGCADERLRQRAGFISGFHKRTRAALYIKNKGFKASGEFFGEDGRGDQIEAFDRACDIADRVEALVGRGEIGRGRDDGEAVIAHGLPEPGHAERSFEASVNEWLMKLIRSNVREPVQVEGDFYALVACNERGSNRLLSIFDEYGLQDLDELGESIIAHSHAAMTDAINAMPKGSWSTTMRIDGYDEPIDLAAKVTVGNGQILVDYAGSSPISSDPIDETAPITLDLDSVP